MEPQKCVAGNEEDNQESTSLSDTSGEDLQLKLSSIDDLDEEIASRALKDEDKLEEQEQEQPSAPESAGRSEQSSESEETTKSKTDETEAKESDLIAEETEQEKMESQDCDAKKKESDTQETASATEELKVAVETSSNKENVKEVDKANELKKKLNVKVMVTSLPRRKSTSQDSKENVEESIKDVKRKRKTNE